jgi:carboxypeptidase Taq
MKNKYENLRILTNKIADIKYAISVLNWDQETYMPVKGQQFRAQQIATLSGIAHELSTSNSYEKALMDLKDEKKLSVSQRKNIDLLIFDFEKSKKLSADFIVKLSQATSKSFHAWLASRKANDFSIFAPELEKMVNIQQEKASIYGYEGHIYDALMEDYEPNATVKEIDKLFEDVRYNLKPFLDKIADQNQVQDNFMYGKFEQEKQWNYGLEILSKLGYDFEAGRQDRSEHPFSTSFSMQDVRVTTRVKEENLYDMLWSCIHECGHALYEQGIPIDQYGLPGGEAVSLGIHESQSRFYENNIGRSRAFWQANYKDLQKVFEPQLGQVNLEEFYKAVNIVKPSLIRTDADELTYHFHIMIRYELEQQLIDGSLKVKDVKEAWNAGYKQYLNIQVPDDNQGVLQDVHWSHGGFGYFPTYSLGSFYAAQFEQKMQKQMPQMNQDIQSGDYTKILNWLRTNIHQHGRHYSSQELCEKATGEKLNFKHFMEYASTKYGEIYRL